MKGISNLYITLLVGLLISVGGCCDKIEPVHPNEQSNTEVTESPLTDGSIFNILIDDRNMAVGTKTWNMIAHAGGMFMAAGEGGLAYLRDSGGGMDPI